MSKHRVAVLEVVAAQSSVTDAAAGCGISRQHLHRLLRRYREGGLDDLEPRSRRPRSRRPHSSPQATPATVLVAWLGIRQKNGAPGHPQTQGKVERFHQTLKRWLWQPPAVADLGALQAQLDSFRLVYNERRPHRVIGRRTPATAYAARPKGWLVVPSLEPG